MHNTFLTLAIRLLLTLCKLFLCAMPGTELRTAPLISSLSTSVSTCTQQQQWRSSSTAALLLRANVQVRDQCQVFRRCGKLSSECRIASRLSPSLNRGHMAYGRSAKVSMISVNGWYELFQRLSLIAVWYKVDHVCLCVGSSCCSGPSVSASRAHLQLKKAKELVCLAHTHDAVHDDVLLYLQKAQTDSHTH